MIKLATLVLLVTVARSQNFNGGDASWYCGILANEDCYTHSYELRCGTNNVTYRNMCELGQSHCKDNTINQQHLGPCVGGGVTTTMTPEQIVHGSQVILDVQCSILSHQSCTYVIGEKICGTDGRTYEDFCEYEKARCTHRDLHVAKLGDCSA